jgi:neutral/alkaline ceramidase-like enzyme
MRHRHSLICLATLALGSAYVNAAAGDGTLRAGAGKVDITPQQSELLRGDFIRDHLYVRAILIDNGKTCAVLVGIDAGGAGTAMVQAATARAAKSTGCPTENFIISATHTHSGSTRGLGDDGMPNAQQTADAIVKAVEAAKSQLQPARIGFGTAQVYLNVNRDLFEGQKWYQGPNLNAGSDKTLAVLEVIGPDDRPIGVYMNYAMHPIDFYLSGVISADFPGEASRYIERRYNKAVAIFVQGASGDQNPLLLRPFYNLVGVRTRTSYMSDDRIGAELPAKISASELNANAHRIEQIKIPIKPEERAAFESAVAQSSEIIAAMGAIIGESSIDVMKNHIPATTDTATIWGAQDDFSCPGRDRLDNSARQGVLPPYRDGADVTITVGMLRLGNIYIASVNGEVYNDIAVRLKQEAPISELMMTTLANGSANSGYIYSNEAGSHLTFQVIGSRLKPGCAEDFIVAKGLDLIRRSTN